MYAEDGGIVGDDDLSFGGTVKALTLLALQPTLSASPKEPSNAMAPSMASCRRLALTRVSDSSHYQVEAFVRVTPRGPSAGSAGML
jgi:hypothetical protein